METSPDVSADEEAPEWPDESVESAMRAEQRERDADVAVAARPRVEKAPEPEEDDAALPLPKLDALIAQIPAQVRETLDELFRARFTSVQRVPKKALK
jgi:hypothetical protein